VGVAESYSTVTCKDEFERE